jgi:inner membrane protein
LDSLTQIVLGAAVGEAVLGKKVGNKAMLYGAIAGTIPDLDVISKHFIDVVTALEYHRGFTHSIVFSLAFAPLFGWLISKWEKKATGRDWTKLFFWGFITHPLLDAHTTWGTQLFWPFDLRLAYKNIFVIDPLYTLPFLVLLVLAMRRKRTDPKRRKLNNLGIIVSSAYLLLSVVLKEVAYFKFKDALQVNNIEYTRLDTRPSPLNTVLWQANVETKEAYFTGNYSLFDSEPIQFHQLEKNHEDLGDFAQYENVQRLIKITEGWYSIAKSDDDILFRDIRFGKLSIDPNSSAYTFTYRLAKKERRVDVSEEPKEKINPKETILTLWDRIKGN